MSQSPTDDVSQGVANTSVQDSSKPAETGSRKTVEDSARSPTVLKQADYKVLGSLVQLTRFLEDKLQSEALLSPCEVFVEFGNMVDKHRMLVNLPMAGNDDDFIPDKGKAMVKDAVDNGGGVDEDEIGCALCHMHQYEEVVDGGSGYQGVHKDEGKVADAAADWSEDKGRA